MRTVWFVALLSLLIGGGVLYSRMQQPGEEAAARLQGALGFIEWRIVRSSEDILDANPYISPAIDASESANSFRVAGRVKLVKRDANSGVERSQVEPYQAIVESLCKPYADKACWRLHALEIAGAPVIKRANGTKTANVGEAVEATEAASTERGPSAAPEAGGRPAATVPIDTAEVQRSATDERVRAPLADNALPAAPEPPQLAAPLREWDIGKLLAKRADSASAAVADEAQALQPSDGASIADGKAPPSMGDIEKPAALAPSEGAEQEQAVEESPSATVPVAARQAERPRAVAETSLTQTTVATAAVSENARSTSGSPVADSGQVAQQSDATEPPRDAAATASGPAATIFFPDVTSDRLVASADDKPVPIAPVPILDETRAVASLDQAPAANESQTPPANPAPDQPVAAEPQGAMPKTGATASVPERQPAAEPPLTEAERVELERDLARLGFYPGPIDGVLDRQSEGAIRSYQDFAALPSSGRPDRKLLAEVRLLAATVTVLAGDLDGKPAQAGADERPAGAEATLRSMAAAQPKLDAAQPKPAEAARPESTAAQPKPADASRSEPTAAQPKPADAAQPKPAEVARSEPPARLHPLPGTPPQKPERLGPPTDQSIAAKDTKQAEPEYVASLEAKPLANSPEPPQSRRTEVAFTVDSLPMEIRQAIQAGKLDVRFDSGHTPLTAAITDGRQDAVAALLEHGANPNLSSEDGATALMYAAWAGDAVSVRLLLQAGAEPNRTNLDAKTALMAAAATGQAEIVEQLLKAGADPDLQAFKGWTALMYAVWRDQAEVVRLLLKYGANTQIQNDDKQTAVDLAADREQADIHFLLLSHNGAG